jgi:ankyrin repeat protein
MKFNDAYSLVMSESIFSAISPEEMKSRTDMWVDRNKWFNAVRHGDIETVRRMLAEGEDINRRTSINSASALIAAVIANKREMVEGLLKYPDIDVNLCDNGGDTPLIWAVYYHCDIRRNSYDMIRMLVNHPGVEINHRNKWNRSAMDYAVKGKDRKMFDYLSEHGAFGNWPW